MPVLGQYILHLISMQYGRFDKLACIYVLKHDVHLMTVHARTCMLCCTVRVCVCVCVCTVYTCIVYTVRTYICIISSRQWNNGTKHGMVIAITDSKTCLTPLTNLFTTTTPQHHIQYTLPHLTTKPYIYHILTITEHTHVRLSLSPTIYIYT